MKILKQMSSSRDLHEEGAWKAMIQDPNADPSWYVYGDFTHQNPHKNERRSGRGHRGWPIEAASDPGYGRRYSTHASLSLTGRGPGGKLGGLIDFSITTDNADSDTACRLIFHNVLPLLLPFDGVNPRSIYVLDNARYYHDDRIRQMIEGVGAKLLFLPPAAKQLNPIEESFSKVKKYIQRHRALSVADPVGALTNAFSSINHEDTEGYFRHSGFAVRRSAEASFLLALGFT